MKMFGQTHSTQKPSVVLLLEVNLNRDRIVSLESSRPCRNDDRSWCIPTYPCEEKWNEATRGGLNGFGTS